VNKSFKHILFLLVVASVGIFAQTTHSIEVRAVVLSPNLELEYRYQLWKYISADVVGSLAFPSVRVGVSIYPVSFAFFQSTIGALQYSEQATDSPLFKPEYFYSFRAGVRIPFGTLPISMSFAFGKTTIVDTDYNPNSGFFVFDQTMLSTQPTRKEFRYNDTFSLGLTYTF